MRFDPATTIFYFFLARGTSDQTTTDDDCYTQDIIARVSALVSTALTGLMVVDEDWLLNRLFSGVLSSSILICLAAVVSRSRWMKKNRGKPTPWLQFVAPNHFPCALSIGYLAIKSFIMTFAEAPLS